MRTNPRPQISTPPGGKSEPLHTADGPRFMGKKRTPIEAIHAFCRRCSGGNIQSNCLSPNCPLYLYRAGRIDAGADRSILRVINHFCREHCLPDDQRGISLCEMHNGYGTNPPCPLWPFRQGSSPNWSMAGRETRAVRAKNRPVQRAQDGKFSSRIASQAEVLVLAPPHLQAQTEANFALLCRQDGRNQAGQ